MTREEAIKDIQDNILPVVGGKSLVMAISALEQPEIIYCKYCKHRTFHDNRISSEQCYVCDYWDFDDPQPNGFCNFAERRGKNESD